MKSFGNIDKKVLVKKYIQPQYKNFIIELKDIDIGLVDNPIRSAMMHIIITIDSETQQIMFQVTEEELAARAQAWVQPPLKANSGVLAKYARLVSSASKGAVTDISE